jgi:dihydroflavonol-4-reductase
MKAFITGATGFVGSHVARVLADQGAEIRLLVRARSNTANIDSLHADRVTGDLRNADSLRHAMAGCDTVFHVAADYRLWTKRPAEMYAANVQGTEAIIDAARQNGVRRVVYTSSVATMGFGKGSGITDE